MQKQIEDLEERIVALEEELRKEKYNRTDLQNSLRSTYVSSSEILQRLIQVENRLDKLGENNEDVVVNCPPIYQTTDHLLDECQTIVRNSIMNNLRELSASIGRKLYDRLQKVPYEKRTDVLIAIDKKGIQYMDGLGELWVDRLYGAELKIESIGEFPCKWTVGVDDENVVGDEVEETYDDIRGWYGHTLMGEEIANRKARLIDKLNHKKDRKDNTIFKFDRIIASCPPDDKISISETTDSGWKVGDPVPLSLLSKVEQSEDTFDSDLNEVMKAILSENKRAAMEAGLKLLRGLQGSPSYGSVMSEETRGNFENLVDTFAAGLEEENISESHDGSEEDIDTGGICEGDI